jgi:hypothetical protein
LGMYRTTVSPASSGMVAVNDTWRAGVALEGLALAVKG